MLDIDSLRLTPRDLNWSQYTAAEERVANFALAKALWGVQVWLVDEAARLEMAYLKVGGNRVVITYLETLAKNLATGLEAAGMARPEGE